MKTLTIIILISIVSVGISGIGLWEIGIPLSIIGLIIAIINYYKK